MSIDEEWISLLVCSKSFGLIRPVCTFAVFFLATVAGLFSRMTLALVQADFQFPSQENGLVIVA